MALLDAQNRLFALARQGKRLPSALAAVVVVFIAFILIIIGQLVAARVAVYVAGASIDSLRNPVAIGAARVLSDGVNFLPAYACVWLALVLLCKRPFWTVGFVRRDGDNVVVPTVVAGLVAVSMVTAVTALIALAPATTLSTGELRTAGPSALVGSAFTLLAFAVQSSGEEVLFRGWLLPVLGARYRPWLAVVGSSALFAVAHAVNPLITPLALTNLFLFGVFLALYALSEGALWGACAWHAAWNWTQYDVFGFPLSGGHTLGVVTSVATAGPNIVTGGAWGMEGGLPATVVLVLGIAIIVLRSRRSDVHRNANVVAAS